VKALQYSIVINAPKEKVWKTLWDDETFRIWANIIDEGTYIKGELKEGNEVQFISSVNGYGVTDYIDKLIPNQFISFKHAADTKETGKRRREKEWTGGTESYTLMEEDGVTRLILNTDVPEIHRDTFNERLPEALKKVKILAEKHSE
jgi:uncharacterized protein YndB with AHSA1/START domain